MRSPCSFLLFMPPHPNSTNLPRIENWTTTTKFGYLFKIVLLLSIFTAVFRSLVVVITRRKRRMSGQSPSPKKNALPTPPAVDKEPNQYLQSLKEETLRPDLGPIYPWITPPQPLPGPYDAPYYPLPAPTIRRHSYDSSDAETEEISTMAPYIRRVSTNSIPKQEHILQGSSTVSTLGWRRTQWTVSVG